MQEQRDSPNKFGKGHRFDFSIHERTDANDPTACLG